MTKDQEAKIVNQVSANLNLTISQLSGFVKEVVQEVEQIQAAVGPLSGADKEQVATDLISSYVNLPFPFSLFQKMAIKLMITYAVKELNQVKGHTWVVPPVGPADPTTLPNSKPQPETNPNDEAGSVG